MTHDESPSLNTDSGHKRRLPWPIIAATLATTLSVATVGGIWIYTARTFHTDPFSHWRYPISHLSTFQAHKWGLTVSVLRYEPKNDVLLSQTEIGRVTGERDKIKLWQGVTQTPLSTIVPDYPYAFLSLSADQKQLAVADWEGTLTMLTATERGENPQQVEDSAAWQKSHITDLKNQGRTNGLAITSDGKTVAISRWADGPQTYSDLSVINVQTKQILYRFDMADSLEANSRVGGFSPDGKLLALARSNYRIELLDTTTGKVLHKLVSAHQPTSRRLSADTQIAFSEDSERLLLGTPESVELWSAKTGDRLRTFVYSDRDTGWETDAIALSPNNKWIAAANFGTTYLWSAETGRLLRTIPEPENVKSIASLAFSSDSRRLFGGTLDGKIVSWQLPIRL